MRHALAWVLLYLFCGSAAAAVTLTDGKVTLYRSGVIVTSFDTYAQCREALETRAAAETRTSGVLTWACRQNVTARYSANPPPPPPPVETWTQCAQEGELCAFTGTRRVRYGAGEEWAVRDIVAINGGVQCGNTVFGDPVFGVRKSCELSSVIPPQQPEPPAPTVGSASLSWNAPTHNVDGSPLTNLAGYFIAYGATCDARTETVQVADPQRTSHTIQGLAPGPYCFAVNAVSTEGAMSEPSDTAQKVVR
jgi:hypothetical protein